jgi:hypothetical protein
MFITRKKNKMKTISAILAIMLFTIAARANTYIISSGKWTDPCLWSGEYTGSTIKAGDTVIITGQVILSVPLVVEGTLRVDKGATLAGRGDITVAPTGTLVNNGSIVVRKIVNEGAVLNNLFVETVQDIENRNNMQSGSMVLAGNNFDNTCGQTSGRSGRFCASNIILKSAPVQLDVCAEINCVDEITGK